jgi:hypothetical protein
MKTWIVGLGVMFVLINMAIGLAAADEYSQYLGQNVTVNSCNVTAFEGTMIENFPDYIVIDEICNPELGNVTIRKDCIIWVHLGVDCGSW